MVTGKAELFDTQLRHHATGEQMAHHVMQCAICGQLPEDPASLCPVGMAIMAEYEKYLWIIVRADAPFLTELITGDP